MQRTHLRLGSIAILLSLGALSSAASAQNCGVRNSYRIANSYSGATSELNVNTGWVTTAPLSIPGSNDNPGATCWSHGSCTPFADYGYLRVTGTGEAQNCAFSGTFLYLDQQPQASFHDTFTPVSTTVPSLTPVQLRVTLAVAGHAVLHDSNPSVSADATLSAGSLGLRVNGTIGTQTGIVDTYVGSPTLLVTDLSVAIYPYGILGLGVPPLQASYSVDLTARVWVECLTPGVTLTTCSGHSYTTSVAQVDPVGGGCGPGSPLLSATLPLLGQVQDYRLTGAPANQPAYFGYSFRPTSNAPVGSCVLAVDTLDLATIPVGLTDASGTLLFSPLIPANPSLAGVRFNAQELVFMPGGPLLGIATLSNGLRSLIGN